MLIAASFLAASVSGSTASADTFPIANPHAVVRGQTYTEWASDYVTWAQEIPLATNPLADPSSPRNCERQSRGMVFVGSNGSDCHVPSGATVAFSAEFSECSTAEGNGHTWRALRRCATSNYDEFLGPDVLHVTLWVDGVKVHHPRRWEFVTPGEIVHLPRHNIWGVHGGRTRSVTEIAFYILKPLSDGTHVVHAHVVSTFIGNFDTYDVFHVG
jgi:hypothetical protein